VDIIRGYDNICAWSARNKLTINIDKTKEIIFHRPASQYSASYARHLTSYPSYITWNWHHLYSLNCWVRKQDATANKPAFIRLVTAQVARHGSSGPRSVIYMVLSCLRSHMHYQPCRPTYRRRQEQDKCNIAKGSASRRHILLLILRKSLIILIANFSARLPTRVIVYTIHFLLKPLNTVLTVLEKENTITSCLMLNSRCIKTVLLIDACLSLDDNTLCVLYYF